MAAACGVCDEAYEAEQRVPKVLPCGHSACLPCLQQHARSSGKLCPVCRKIFRSDPADLVNNEALLEITNKTWCVDCDALAAPRCFELHALCGLRRLEREAESELAALRAVQAAALRRLEDDLLRERAELAREPTRRDLPTLRGMVAAAKTHSLLLVGGERPLHRALDALQREKILADEWMALADREATVAGREAAVRDKESALQAREAAQQNPEKKKKGQKQSGDGNEEEGMDSEDQEEKDDKEEEKKDDEEGEKEDEEEEKNEDDDKGDGDEEEDEEDEAEGECEEDDLEEAEEEEVEEEEEEQEDEEEASSGENEGKEHQVVAKEQEEWGIAAPGKEARRRLSESAHQDDMHLVAGMKTPSKPRTYARANLPGASTNRSAPGSDAAVRDGPPSGPSGSASTSRAAGSVVGTAQAPLDALPDGLLELVLAAVPTDGWSGVPLLLELRLVCRRWSHVVLRPAVWRHRRVEVTNLWQLRLLGLVPVLDYLKLEPTIDDIPEMMRALAYCRIEVRSLDLVISVTNVCSNLFHKILGSRKATLRALRLSLYRKTARSSVSGVFDALDSTSALRSLMIETDISPLEFEFRRPTNLQRLELRGSPHPWAKSTTEQTYGSLVSMNKTTLLHVDCGVFNLMQQLVECTRLRSVVVCPRAGLRALCERPQLQDLQVRCLDGVHLGQLKEALDSATSLPRRIGVVLRSVYNGTCTLREAADSLSRVHRFELDGGGYLRNLRLPDLLHVFKAMTHVEELVVRKMDYLEWPALLRGWEATTLPALRAVHMECHLFEQTPGSTERQYYLAEPEQSWLKGLRELRPHLVTTTAGPRQDAFQ